jgi:DNA-binding GntR family transcriptional regulator
MSVERHCMSDRIRRELAKRILNGTLPAGHRLVELNIAREFDTSQTPVREALRELETQRLVESVPYRGTRVRDISKQEMAEAYAVRGALEQFAAQLAVCRLKGDVKHIRQAVTGLHEAAKANDIESFAKWNIEFHRSIVAASGNTVLLQTWESLSFETRMRVNLAHIRPNLPERAAEHDPIADALEAGDGIKAGLLLRTHAESFMKFWMDQPSSEPHSGKDSPDVIDSCPLQENSNTETAIKRDRQQILKERNQEGISEWPRFYLSDGD